MIACADWMAAAVAAAGFFAFLVAAVVCATVLRLRGSRTGERE